jgi:DNA-binding SARP family transcriptional activator
MLVRHPEPISRRRLAGELFSDADDPMGALRWTLAELRRRTGAREGFRSDPVELAFGDAVHIDVLDLSAEAIDERVVDGEFLEGIDVRSCPEFESWLLVERQRVDSEVLGSLRQAALHALAERDAARAVDCAAAMVRRAPYEEGSHVLLVRALVDSGDHAGAQRRVELAEQMFRDELGVTPTAAIRNAARPQVAAPVPGVPAAASARSLLEAGLAAVSAGAVDAGIECLRRATSDAESAGDQELLSRCLVELGTTLVHSIRGFDDEGAVMLESAATIASSAGTNATAAKARSELAYVDLLAGRRTNVTRNLAQARELAQGDLGLLAAIGGFEAMNLSDWGRADEAERSWGEAVDLARRSGIRRRLIWSLGIGARTWYREGRFDEAVAWASEAIELGEQERWTAFRPWPETWIAHARLARGDDPLVVRHDVEATFALATQLQDPCWEGVSAKMLGLTYLAERDYETGLSWIANASVWCNRVTDPYVWVEVDARCVEARAALEIGDRERAETAARRAVIGAARGQMDDLLREATDALTAAT